jgi:undecaprenyl diphosphate synthase
MTPSGPAKIPLHVAIIMDGNGRWAKQRSLPRLEGHRRGVETVRTVVDAARDLIKNRVRLLTIGRTRELPANVQRELQRVIDATRGFTEWTLVLALNYGSRTEIADAAGAYGRAVRDGRENPAESTWENFSRYLYTADIPEPDLLIRTSGEQRVSNFLLMQCAYSEMVFTSVLWPDFGKADLQAALDEYGRRERRYGLTAEQIKTGAR